MALHFSELEKISFGSLEIVPKMTQELRLRVADLKIKPNTLDKARKVMSECFGEYAEEVNDFMKQNFSQMDFVRLQTYLVQGDAGLEDLNRRMDAIMDKQIEKALEKATEDAEETADE